MDCVMNTSEIAELIDKESEGADSWLAVASRLRATAKESPEWTPFVAALEYMLETERRPERRARFGPFAPMVEYEAGSYPPALADVEDEWLHSWAGVLEIASSLPLRARLSDLLWLRRWGDEPFRRAQDAIDSYFELASTWEDLQAGDCLVRALELSRELNDGARQTRVTDELVQRVAQELESEEWKPGVPLRMVAALLELPVAAQPAAIDELLLRARERYASDPHITESVIDFQVARARVASGDEEALRREQVSRWREAAAGAQGMLRFAHLQHALEVARVHGLGEAEEIRRELQDFDRDELDLKRVSASASVPADEIEAVIVDLVGADWREGVTRVGAFGPPVGEYEDNASTVRELMEQHPIQFLFNRVILGPENSVIAEAASKEEQFLTQLARYEHQRASFWGLVLVEVLERIRDQHGTPSFEEAEQFFTSEFVAPEAANGFARGLFLFWEGKPDEAAHVVVPRLEAVIRELCRRAGLVVTREPIDNRPGGVRGLGENLRQLHGRFDESWWRYLWTLLVEPLGLNVRNLVSHGLVSRVEPPVAALTLQVACFLSLLRDKSGGSDDSPT
jgi:hypothetical protein